MNLKGSKREAEGYGQSWREERLYFNFKIHKKYMYPKFSLTICVTHTYRYIDEYYTPPRKLLSFQNHSQDLACAAQCHGQLLFSSTSNRRQRCGQWTRSSTVITSPLSKFLGHPGRYCLFQNPSFIHTVYSSDALASAIQPYYDG